MFSSALRKSSLTIPSLLLKNNQGLVFTSSRFFGAKKKISPEQNKAQMNKNMTYTYDRDIDNKVRKHEAEEEEPQFIASKQRGQHFKDEQMAGEKDNIVLGPNGEKMIGGGPMFDAARKRINRRPGSRSAGIPKDNLVDVRDVKEK